MHMVCTLLCFGVIIILGTDQFYPYASHRENVWVLPDWAWIWLDFPEFKHDYIKEVYWSNMCFAGRSPQTGDFHGDCILKAC